MSRNLLHKKHLDEFKSWLQGRGVPHRPGKGDWQVLQVEVQGVWYAVYKRAFMPEHLTVAGNKLEKLVRKFYDDQKGRSHD